MLLGVAFVSAAGLAFEITLTRLFAIAQGYHFGFLAVSLALLGFGASGTALAVRPSLARGRTDEITERLAYLALSFSIGLALSYLAINYLPFDSYRIAWEPIQLLYLVLYYLALTTPFFLGGLTLGLPLAALPVDKTARVYAANLAGAGLGCIIALGSITLFDATGAVMVAAILAGFGAFVFARHATIRYLTIGVLAVFGGLLLTRPAFFDLRLSPYKSLSQTLRIPNAHLVSNAWNAYSQVQVVESSTVRSAPGLSLTYRGTMPTQRALFVDAEGISPLTNAAPRDLLDRLLPTLAYQLRPNARALIIEPGGGLEVLAALNAGARETVVLVNNPLLAEALQTWAPHIVSDPRVQIVVANTRGYLARSRERFEVVHLALGDAFHPVTAGAYSLGENYLFTREAFADYFEHLDAEGILVVHRWLQLPPAEEARAAALAMTALERNAPEEYLIALRSFSTMLLLAKRTPFTAHEIEMARAFADTYQFDWVAYPGMRANETNRFNVLREDEYARVLRQLLDSNQRARLLATHPYDITPTSDDRPFFFHFFRWEQIPQVVQLLGKLWQPFGGSGFLILIVLLALSVVISAALILLPLWALRRASGPPDHLVYFACLGIGFLLIEIPLIQRFILFLDQPVYAFATVLFTLLIASGIGSYCSARLPLRTTLIGLVVIAIALPGLLPFVFQRLIGEAFIVRALVSFMLLAPLGFLMGIPFPKGLALLKDRAPYVIPLAWGVNGCASVISSILATLGAMSFGFSAVLLAGAGAYAMALVLARQWHE